MKARTVGRFVCWGALFLLLFFPFLVVSNSAGETQYCISYFAMSFGGTSSFSAVGVDKVYCPPVDYFWMSLIPLLASFVADVVSFVENKRWLRTVTTTSLLIFDFYILMAVSKASVITGGVALISSGYGVILTVLVSALIAVLSEIERHTDHGMQKLSWVPTSIMLFTILLLFIPFCVFGDATYNYYQMAFKISIDSYSPLLILGLILIIANVALRLGAVGSDKSKIGMVFVFATDIIVAVIILCSEPNFRARVFNAVSTEFYGYYITRFLLAIIPTIFILLFDAQLCTKAPVLKKAVTPFVVTGKGILMAFKGLWKAIVWLTRPFIAWLIYLSKGKKLASEINDPVYGDMQANGVFVRRAFRSFFLVCDCFILLLICMPVINASWGESLNAYGAIAQTNNVIWVIFLVVLGLMLLLKAALVKADYQLIPYLYILFKIGLVILCLTSCMVMEWDKSAYAVSPYYNASGAFVIAGLIAAFALIETILVSNKASEKIAASIK